MSTEFDYRASFALGHSYNQKIAKRLQDSGVDCYAPELRYAETTQEIASFTQNDRDVIFSNINGWIEVKSSSTYWEDGDVSSIRSNFSSLFVDTVSSYREKLTKPLAYVLVSQHTEGVLVVPTTTEPHWETKYLYDRFRNIYDDFFLVDYKHLRTFEELVAHIKAQEQGVK